MITFCYARKYPPSSEYHTLKRLERGDTVFCTSTASIFHIVRAWCFQHNLRLHGSYEGRVLTIDQNMRMQNWSECPDFNLVEDALETLLGGHL